MIAIRTYKAHTLKTEQCGIQILWKTGPFLPDPEKSLIQTFFAEKKDPLRSYPALSVLENVFATLITKYVEKFTQKNSHILKLEFALFFFLKNTHFLQSIFGWIRIGIQKLKKVGSGSSLKTLFNELNSTDP